MSNDKILKDPHISSLLLRMALPAIAAGFVDLLYNIADSIFVGRFVGENALAALTIIGSLQLFFIGLSLLFSVGCSSIISRALGAKNITLAENTIRHGFWFSSITSFIISLIVLYNLDNFLVFLGATQDTLPYAKSYGGIILWTIFIGPINNVLGSSIRAKGLVGRAMLFVFIGASLNILLDALFIVGFRWGGAGAATATALSQFIVAILLVREVKKLYNIHFRIKEYFSWSLIRNITTIGFPSALRLFLFSFGMTLSNKNLSSYGVTALSASGICFRITPLAMILTFGLAGGCQPLLGINYGAGLYNRSHTIIKTALLFCFYFSLPFTILFWWAPAWLFFPFTTNIEIIRLAQENLRWIGGLMILWSYFALAADIFQSLGFVKQGFKLMIFYPLTLIFGQLVFPQIIGLKGIWLSSPFSFICSGALSLFFLRKTLKILKNKEKNEEKSSTF